MDKLESLYQRIKDANEQVAVLNQKRNHNIGKMEALQSQCDTLIKAYKDSYGVDLSIETLDAEVERVIKSKESEVTTLESAIRAITEGRYADAYSVLGIESNEVVDSTQNAVSNEGTMEASEAVVTSADVNEKVEAVDDSISPPKISPASELVGTDTNSDEDVVLPPTPKAVDTLPSMQGFSEPIVEPPHIAVPSVAPPTVPNTATVSPKSEQVGSTPKSFEAILGGTQFMNK